MQRYLVENDKIINNIITIDNSDVHHIKNVMRMKIGNKIYCFTKSSILYLCEIIELGDIVRAKILEEVDCFNELDKNITIAQGLINRDKTEEVIRRLVELGCSNYQPVIMDKSIIKVDNNMNEKQKNNRLLRLEKIVKEASEQSQRVVLMNVKDVISFKGLIDSFSNYDLVLVCHVANKNDLNTKELINKNLKDANNVLVVVGPESGFSNNEIKLFNEAKTKMDKSVHFVSLGKRVLRTETAPLSIMSILSYEVENNE